MNFWLWQMSQWTNESRINDDRIQSVDYPLRQVKDRCGPWVGFFDRVVRSKLDKENRTCERCAQPEAVR